jgi:hypothetical protein
MKLPFLGNKHAGGASDVLAQYRRFSPSLPVRLACAAVLFVLTFAFGVTYAATFPYALMPHMVPAVGLTALVIWALPDSERAPVGALPPLFFAFTGAMYLWPNYLAIALPGLPWLTMLRLFGTPMTLLLLVCVSMSASFRAKITAAMTVDPFVWRLFVAFATLQVLSVGFSSEPANSVAKVFISVTNWYAVFFVGLYVFGKPGMATRWMLLLLFCTLVLCGISIWEAALGAPPWAGHIPPFLRVDDPAVQRTLSGVARAGLAARRVAATTAHPLILAEFLGLMVPFAVHILLQRYHVLLRIAAGLSLPLIGWCINLTDSRLGVGAGLLSVIIYLFFWASLRWARIRDSILAPAIVLAYPVIFSLFIVATFAIGRLRAEVWGGGATQPSTQARIDQWDGGIPRILRRPWGYGTGRGADVLGFTNPSGTLTIDTYYLSMLLEYGVLGFLIYFGMFLRAIWVGGRAGISERATGELLLLIPLTIALVNFVVVKSVLSSEANHPMIFIMLAAVLALTLRVRQADAAAASAAAAIRPPPAPSPRRTGAAARPNRR